MSSWRFNRIIIFTTLIVLLAYGLRSQRESHPEIQVTPQPTSVESSSSSMEATPQLAFVAPPTIIPGGKGSDINGDGRVDCTDLQIVTERIRAAFLIQQYDRSIDLDGDGYMTVLDFSIARTDFQIHNPGTACNVPSLEEWKAQYGG